MGNPSLYIQIHIFQINQSGTISYSNNKKKQQKEIVLEKRAKRYAITLQSIKVNYCRHNYKNQL